MKQTMKMLGLVGAMLLIALVTNVSAQGVAKEPFSPDRFKALQAAGEVVLLDVFADWCPTCAQQQKVLAAYRAQHPNAKFTILEINFDRDKQWVREYKAPRQSTLILYRGDRQVWYAVAETRSEVIFAELNKATTR